MRGATHRTGLAVLGLAGGLLWGAPAAAQDSGQWWWDASVGLAQQNHENLLDGSTSSEYDQTDLKVGVGLNGFIVHPAVAEFRIGVDALLSQYDNSRDLDTDQWGARADLDLFSRGGYPTRLFYGRQIYDYSVSADESPFTRLGAIDTGTHWGGSFRMRKGPLRGLLLGGERSEFEFLSPATERETRERDYMDWSRTMGSFQHHVRLERRLQEFGTVDLDLDDFTLNIEERADLGTDWTWEMSAAGIRRKIESDTTGEFETDNYGLRNRFLHDVRGRDSLELRANSDLFRPEASPSSDSHALSVFYHWRPQQEWEIAPFVQYAYQSSGDMTQNSPRAGVSVSWKRARRSLDTLLSGRTSYGFSERSGPDDTGDDSQFAYGLSGSLGHGEVKGLRKGLEFELVHNELRFVREPIFEIPDLSLSRFGLGTDDLARGRVTLSHRWDSSGVTTWGEWSLRQSEDSLRNLDTEAETVRGTLDLTLRGLQLQVNAGDTSVTQDRLGDQEIRFHGVSVGWRARNYLTVRSSYRQDTRELTLVPDVDSDRLEIGFDLRFGRLSVNALIFDNTDVVSGARERTDRGVIWSVNTRFAGWLPIVTGTDRRGVIR